jgi:hypothetical protein
MVDDPQRKSREVVPAGAIDRLAALQHNGPY